MGSKEDNILIFNENDFILTSNGTDSKFDKILKEKWTRAQDKGVFRYIIKQNSLETKIISKDKYNFIVQLNEGRGSLRRTPDMMTSLQMPFDENKFNFTKIKPDEILFSIKSSDNEEDEATIIINASPIEFCNSLLVPHLYERRAQVFSAASLRLAISVVALSGHKSLKAGFNSLGAMASVNHQHWHIYYYEYDLVIDSCPIVNNILTQWPIPSIAFELTKINAQEIDFVVNKISKIIDFCLNDAQIAHNLFVSRTKSNTIRIYVWPRESVFGAKNDMQINPAFCEFSGFFMSKTRQMFDEIDENFCVRILQSVNTRIEEMQHLLQSFL